MPKALVTRRPRARRAAALAAAAAVVLSAAACGDDEPTADDSPPAATSSPTGDTDDTDDTGTAEPTSTPATGTVLAADAAAAAVAAVGGAAVEIDDDSDDGTQAWEVLVRTDDGDGIEVYIDMATGEVLRQEPEDLPDEARSRAPAVPIGDAIATALDAVPGVVHEVDLDTEDGAVVWEIQIRHDGGETEVYVDATTGRVVKTDRDD